MQKRLYLTHLPLYCDKLHNQQWLGCTLKNVGILRSDSRPDQKGVNNSRCYIKSNRFKVLYLRQIDLTLESMLIDKL